MVRPVLTVVLVAVASALILACGSEKPASFAAAGEAPESAGLVVGADLREWGLLVVPRAGGPATLRPVGDPGRVVWTFATELPASDAAHVLDDRWIVLRSAEGGVYRFDPSIDRLERVAEVAPEAEWRAFGPAAALVDSTAGEVLHLSAAGTWRYELPHPLLWAAPVDQGGLILLLDVGAERELWLVRNGEERPAGVVEASLQPPGVVTAWGRRVALVDPSEGGVGLRFATVTPLGLASRVGLPGRATVLAASPSSHEIYAALADPPRLVAIGRFSGEIRRLAQLPGSAEAIRVGLFGGSLLVRTGDAAFAVDVSGGEPTRLPFEWRSDLPLGLPGDLVLGAGTDGMGIVRLGGPPGGRSLDAPADAWWLPLRWTPPGGELLASAVGGEGMAGGAAGPPSGASRGGEEGRASGLAGAGGGAADGSGADEDAAADGSTGGRFSGDPGAIGARDADEDLGEDEPPREEPPDGYYAIVVSARSPEGVERLLGSLREAGYPTAVQTVTDDAGQTWHRGLVGPYAGRTWAEAAARELARGRDLRPWVTEIP